jgi:hypothetical protein
VVLAVVAGLVWYFFYFAPPTHGTETRFSVLQDGVLTWYALNGTSATVVAGPAGFAPAPAVRFAAQRFASGDIPVIVDSGTDSGTVLAILKTDGTMKQIVTDGIPKYDLAGRPDGRVAYAIHSAKAMDTSPRSAWRLMSLPVLAATPVPIDLGPGFSSAFSGDGSLVAIAPEGLVRINPSNKGRYMLIDRAGMNYGVAAVGPDASLALLPNAVTGSLDVFSLATDNPASISYIGSVPGTADAAAFVGGHTFMVKIGTSFTLYDATSGFPVAKGTYTLKP